LQQIITILGTCIAGRIFCFAGFLFILPQTALKNNLPKKEQQKSPFPKKGTGLNNSGDIYTALGCFITPD